jgi:hypothetical protein
VCGTNYPIMRFDLPTAAGKLGLSPELSREAAMGNWKLDPYHTQVEFSAKHLGMMTVRGYFFRQLILRMAPGAQRRSYALTAGRRSARGPAPERGAR